MYPYVVVFSMLFSASLTMAGVMMVAWAGFGRPPHAISWGAAFGLNALQVGFNAAAMLGPGRHSPLMAAAIVLTVMPSALIAIGARQRANLPPRFGPFAAAVVTTLCLVLATARAVPARDVYLGVPFFFTATMLGICVAAIVPRGRKPVPAEWALIVVDSIFAALELLMGVLALIYFGDPTNLIAGKLYAAILGIALPTAFVASGIMAILLIASDLATRLKDLAQSDLASAAGTLSR